MHYTKPEVYEFISKQTSDPIVERKTCEVSGQKFAIFQSDLDFYDKISPVFNGKKYKIPTPRLCPEERQRRMMLWRNENKLYRRKCDATGETMISIYSSDKEYIVYSPDFWWSDSCDADKRFLDIDFNKKIVKQFDTLMHNSPKIGLFLRNNENTEYGNDVEDSKNCYMVFNSRDMEDCYHCCAAGISAKSLCDCYFTTISTHCYEGNSLSNSYNSHYCKISDNLQNCLFCEDCISCKDCFACKGLRNKSFCIFNKEYDEDTYKQQINKLNLSDYKNIQLIKENVKTKLDGFPSENMKNINSQNCIGNYLENCNNCTMCFDSKNTNNCKYTSNGLMEDSLDTYNCGTDSNLFYYSLSTYFGHKIMFSIICTNSSNMRYSFECINCKNCFACSELRDKQYCIFNKQYTKEEYEQLVPQIIEKMMEEGSRGEFFDPSLSPFGYNETVAQEYFPLTRDEALARGYKRQDNNYDPKIPNGVETLKGDDIPTNINDVNDDILKKIFICEVSGRPFRIIKQELDFYRKHNLPLPRKHPDIRHQERLKQRPPRELHLRKCDKCEVEMLSVYSQDSEKTVYCEKCYQDEVY